nr:MAG TPA_asm: hypothetical protein [Caudoviricetes sp.]
MGKLCRRDDLRELLVRTEKLIYRMNSWQSQRTIYTKSKLLQSL